VRSLSTGGQARELHDKIEGYENGSYVAVDFEPDAFFTLERPASDGKIA
jgi:hypothetical protein